MMAMRRVLAARLLLAVLCASGLVCPCPPAQAAAMQDDHGCCAQEGWSAATSCCLTTGEPQEEATLDGVPGLLAPAPRAVLLGPVVAAAAAPASRAACISASPPSILRI